MGTAPRVTVGLAAFALLLLGGLGSAAAQSGAEDAINSRVDPKARSGVDRGRTRQSTAIAVAPARSTRAATPATPATPAVPGVSAATPATPAVPASAIAPPGLSKDAPGVGVIGGGGRGGGRSPASTPEPTTLLLVGAGIAGLYGIRRRR